jgi:hypothetical protein
VEAEQWLQQNGNMQGPQLMEAARQENWDPSIQALIAFPDALRVLATDVRWTTDLGNAFLAQQADVMAAVQRMRQRARANGWLGNTQQQTVTTEAQNGQSAIDIQPADPEMAYVPSYNPDLIWGPPAYGMYPDLWYPDFGFGFGPPVYMGAFFPGWLGWGGWGWGFGWLRHGLFLNVGFFNHYGFHGGYFGGAGARAFGAGRVAWAHDPSHREGVPYSNAAVASRFHGSTLNAAAGGYQRFGGGGYRAGSIAPTYRAPQQSARGYGGTYSRYSAPAYSAPRQSYSYSAPRQSYSYAAPRQSYSAPRSYSAPHYSAPHYSAPHYSGGGGGHVSHGGGGGHSGGGGHHR